MPFLLRFLSCLLLVSVLTAPAAAKSSVKEAEYKRADTAYYWLGDVLKVYPHAVIIPEGDYQQKGDSYFIPRSHPPKEIYLQVVNDWIEPITPPSMPASLGIPADAMQVRESQGDVQVALPSNPANFSPVQDGMSLPNGAVVKTGANGTVAVLFGGVDSARLAPNTEAAVQQTVTPDLRSTEVDLKSGAVFSKVGQRLGEAQDYTVHTPFGIAAAKGTDFVSVVMPARTDVWIAQGTVQLTQPSGAIVGTVSSEGKDGLKIVRFPVMDDPSDAMRASSETMTAAMAFIPMANVKIKALRDKLAAGQKLTARERDYLGRIKKVPCLIRLTYVEPPAPPAPPPVPPAPPVQKVTKVAPKVTHPAVVAAGAVSPASKPAVKAKVRPKPVVHSEAASSPATSPASGATASKTPSGSATGSHHTSEPAAPPISTGSGYTVP